MPRKFSDLINEARTLLQDHIPTSGGVQRYSDFEMLEAINTFVTEVRAKRPDLFIPMGLRQPVPYYTTTDTVFPLDLSVWSAFVYYLVGRAELREDTWSDDGRATAMMNKAVSQLLSVQS
jgi:hypothetical protein